MKVAIIGSGASGLTAIKCCLDEGLHPVCFEKADDIGGLWNYALGKKKGASVYRSTITNTSKEMMCYSDFPFLKEYPNYMHRTKVQEYYNFYADRFKLRSCIQFHTEVLSCTQADGFSENGQWKITSKNMKSGDEKFEYYDAVLVCIGHHAFPYLPTDSFDGIDDFKGQILHSHDYRDQRGFEDKRVVVIGIGNSGGDVAVELGKHSKRVFLSTRRGTWVMYRVHDNGMPIDINISTRFSMILRRLLPSSYFDVVEEKRLNRRMDHTKYGLKPDHPPFSQHFTINDELPSCILSGAVSVKPNVARMTEKGVVFDDGTKEDVDVIIFATGYTIKYPFLEERIVRVMENKADLYKFMWPTNLEKNTLAIIGAVQPHGAINPISEMQCRWATQVFKGDATLPSREVMMKDIERKETALQVRYVKTRRHTIQVNYLGYMDGLAQKINCKPDVLHYLITDPKLGFKLLFGPAVPYQFRLEGPGKWSDARKMILTINERVLYPLQSRKVQHPKPGGSHLLRLFVVSWVALAAAFTLKRKQK